jgi:hypothetical protein
MEYSRSIIHITVPTFPGSRLPLSTDTGGIAHVNIVNIGGGQSRHTKEYMPLLKRKQGGTGEVVN